VLSEFFEEENKEGKPLPFGAMVKHDCLLKVSLVSGRRGWGGEGSVHTIEENTFSKELFSIFMDIIDAL